MNATDAAPKGVPFDLGNFVTYADGSVVSKTLLNRTSGTMTLFAFDEGQGLSEHTAPFDAAVYILDGEAEISIGDEKTNAATGDMLVMPANIPHALQARRRFKMLLVMIRGE